MKTVEILLFNKCFLPRAAIWEECLCNVYSTQQKDKRESLECRFPSLNGGTIWNQLHKSHVLCSLNGCLVGPGFNRTNTRACESPGEQRMGQGRTLPSVFPSVRPSLRCAPSTAAALHVKSHVHRHRQMPTGRDSFTQRNLPSGASLRGLAR